MTFRKILIANRGEIACRIIRTARRHKIATVAVYAEADRTAQHVLAADEAIHIGPSPAAQSYLNGDKIIAAARRTGAEAIHPGYGFLSENADFIEAVEAAGLIFIGPPASAVRAMGLKDAAKALMETAGVPVVPGYHGDNQDADFLAGQAARIGYPVMIKARAGGGGKGMRKVDDPADFAEALASARREGQASFGDGTCLIEKFIANPRHIEIQVFGDAHGNVVHLFERDCSLQRRHQKVIEEAPAPGMTAPVRAAMGDAAVKAAKAVGYQGAGTVEFIVDGSGDLRTDGFYFMEMNTRLQVEHPVTEMITGLDLVALQLTVAAGQALPFEQGDLHIDGWAFEARLYAESPAKGFLPQTGRLDFLDWGPRREHQRIDSGVVEGDRITPFYDPMIAKLIARGGTRAEALAALAGLLKSCAVGPLETNRDFLLALTQHEGFAAGRVDTGLIERDIDQLLAPRSTARSARALAAAHFARLEADDDRDDPWEGLTGWHNWSPIPYTIVLEQGDERSEVRISRRADGTVRVRDGAGEVMTLRFDPIDAGGRGVEIDGHHVGYSTGDRRRPGTAVTIMLRDEEAHHFRLVDLAEISGEEADADGDIRSPMPGLVQSLSVSEGQVVAAGDTLCVMTAMKMEHRLTAPGDGRVADLSVKAGDQVEEKALLMRVVGA